MTVTREERIKEVSGPCLRVEAGPPTAALPRHAGGWTNPPRRIAS